MDRSEADAINYTLMGLGYLGPMKYNAKTIYIDGNTGSDVNDGKTPRRAKKTIQAGVTAAGAWGRVFVFPKLMAAGASDPSSYAETIIIPATHDGLSIIGVGTGLTQGGLPQIKKGSGTTALLTVRAPGCLIANMGFNGVDATGGGILLDDDSGLPAGSGGETKSAFGTTISGCHIKNCQGAGKASTGGGIMATGSSWQVRISGCRFYKNRAGITIMNTTYSVPQDWIIEDCVFGGDAVTSTVTDADIYVAASGCLGLEIRRCDFLTPDGVNYASGDADRYIKLNDTTIGMVSDCTFACLVNPAASELTFGAAGTAAIIPTSVRIANCWGETSSTTERGWVNRV